MSTVTDETIVIVIIKTQQTNVSDTNLRCENCVLFESELSLLLPGFD